MGAFLLLGYESIDRVRRISNRFFVFKSFISQGLNTIMLLIFTQNVVTFVLNTFEETVQHLEDRAYVCNVTKPISRALMVAKADEFDNTLFGFLELSSMVCQLLLIGKISF